MPNPHGTPIWYELLTPDPDASQAFYREIMLWTFSRPPGGMERDYRIVSAGDHGIAGLMNAPEGADFAPCRLCYIGVDDVDAAADRLERLGGRVDIEPTDIPNIGRFAFARAPQGARCYLMRGAREKASGAFAPATVGRCV